MPEYLNTNSERAAGRLSVAADQKFKLMVNL
jgi:hypothetical protein